MSELYSVNQVAELLGLHVRTVRGYVRDGRLKAVRIGKQYRIARADLEELTGQPVPAPASETARRSREVRVTSIVEVEAVSPDAMSRLTTAVIGSAGARSGVDDRLAVQTAYDEERGSMKIVVLGDPGPVAEVLRIIDVLLDGQL